MKNTIKLFGIIAFVAVINFITISSAWAQQQDPDTNFRYEPINGGRGIAITGYIGQNINVAIPAKIQNLPVVKAGGFSGSKIISVVFPAGIEEIAANAFSGCPNITSIVIPANVKQIGHSAFQNCSSLTSVAFNGKETIIGDFAFQNCRNLEKLVFSDGSLKPDTWKGPMGPRSGLGGGIEFFTEHYFYNPPIRTGGDYVFRLHSGATAFRNCDKLPPVTLSKLKTMGFLSTEEMNELERKARLGEL
ncbi:MAG: leucine-rich repeat domain-containing protein [Treponema sp.]|jgi:hypothetical protein|nr:leucine-rich repeat domain-containing protein [Treponema sp.]